MSRESGQFWDSTLGVSRKIAIWMWVRWSNAKVYFMGEGGGFSRVQAVVSQVSLELPVACPSTKGVPECELINLLVGLMQVRVSE